METITLLSILVSTIYLLRVLLFFYGATKERRKNIPSSSQTLSLSIIVPARNEENNIKECVESFSSVNYPKDKFELIIVNDRSDDKTGEIIDNLAKEYSFVKPVHAKEERAHKNLQGKAGALDLGIQNSKFDYILMTDADCIVNPDWLDSIASVFENENPALIASFTLIEANNFFSILQALEWTLLHTIASGGVGINFPMGCFGNNISIKKDVYQKIGGYKNIEFSVTEDLALLQSVFKLNLKARYLCNLKASVTTKAIQKFKDYVNQHHRWIIGGKGLGTKGHLFIHITTLIWISIFYLLINENYTHAFSLILVKFFGDILIILPSLIKLRLNKLFKHIFAYQIFIMIVELLSPTLLFKKKVKWKKQVFN